MPVVFRIVPAVIGPLPLTERTVDVLGRACAFGFPHDGHIGADKLLAECGGLPHESRNDPLVTLGQHGRDDVPLGTEVEQGKEVVELLRFCVLFRRIDIGKLIHHGIGDDLVIVKRQAAVEIQLLRCAWLRCHNRNSSESLFQDQE